MDRASIIAYVAASVYAITIISAGVYAATNKEITVNQFIKQFCNANKTITLEQHQKCIWRMEDYK